MQRVEGGGKLLPQKLKKKNGKYKKMKKKMAEKLNKERKEELIKS